MDSKTKLVLFVILGACLLVSGEVYQRGGRRGRLVEVSRGKRQTTGPLDCGGTYTAPTGYFHTPGFPVYHPDNTTCRWHIQVSPPYERIKLEFVPMISLHSFVSEDGTRYCLDYVKVHDGDSAEAPFELWCGHGIAPSLYSTGNSMYLEFVSDLYPASYRGFMAIYAGIRVDNSTECVDLEKMEEPMSLPTDDEPKQSPPDSSKKTV
ncbi:CUB domain-containing protein 2-like [Watersipora subatra]|uniref:CUB domain-containing protein 2-like n=1 Tax=Watersipora subatra TaxID=2589382 RepID=UPI00355C90D0